MNKYYVIFPVIPIFDFIDVASFNWNYPEGVFIDQDNEFEAADFETAKKEAFERFKIQKEYTFRMVDWKCEKADAEYLKSIFPKEVFIIEFHKIAI